MITRAIVEEIISPYKVRVRIPILDRLSYTPLSVDTQELNIATICSLPNCSMNIQVGDIVFVGFEDNTAYKAVVLGYLAKDTMPETYIDAVFRSLEVKDSITLPTDTNIGYVTADEIARLSGVRENLQAQIDDLNEQLTNLITRLRLGETS